jgi:hypothetical protein
MDKAAQAFATLPTSSSPFAPRLPSDLQALAFSDSKSSSSSSAIGTWIYQFSKRLSEFWAT